MQSNHRGFMTALGASAAYTDPASAGLMTVSA